MKKWLLVYSTFCLWQESRSTTINFTLLVVQAYLQSNHANWVRVLLLGCPQNFCFMNHDNMLLKKNI